MTISNTYQNTKHDSKYFSWIDVQIKDPSIQQWAGSLIKNLCLIDTTTKADLTVLGKNEDATFFTIKQVIGKYLDSTHTISLQPIDQSIASDPYYTTPHYAGSCFGNFEQVYNHRKNLFICDTRRGDFHRWLLHAHIDTVPPFLPVRYDDTTIYGRGSVDVKSGIVAIALVLRFLSELAASTTGREISSNMPIVDVAFTIDEETGGNGSLSVAHNLNFNTPYSVIVLEPTLNIPHPANRGAIWFQLKLDQKKSKASTPPFDVIALLSTEVLKELYFEGKKLKEEGVHKLFLPEHVQTCIGIWGDFGIFPASSCQEVLFFLSVPWTKPVTNQQPNEFNKPIANSDTVTLEHHLNELLINQSREHGLVISRNNLDLTHVSTDENEKVYTIRVKAKSGHMGSLKRDTDAAIQAAFLMSAIHELGIGKVSMNNCHPLLIEGGQGFTPSHPMDHVATRIRNACKRGLDHGCKLLDIDTRQFKLDVCFEKIHNEAFCSDLEALGVVKLRQAAIAVGTITEDQVTSQGWQASCDARIFARDCKDVTTFGPGPLELAHNPDEHVKIEDILKAAAIIFLTIIEGDHQ